MFGAKAIAYYRIGTPNRAESQQKIGIIYSGMVFPGNTITSVDCF